MWCDWFRRLAWSIRMEGYGGSGAAVTDDRAVPQRRALGWLEVECNRCKTRASLSKNGTPEERAAKAAAKPTPATVIEISSQSSDNQRLAKAAEAGPTIVEFIQQLRAYVVQEFARGKDVDQIFGDLEESYRRLEKALRKS